jgi:hypothetical protein
LPETAGTSEESRNHKSDVALGWRQRIRISNSFKERKGLPAFLQEEEYPTMNLGARESGEKWTKSAAEGWAGARREREAVDEGEQGLSFAKQWIMMMMMYDLHP